MSLAFVKYHALGNDYLVYSDDKPFTLTNADIKTVCNRHFGIGSDGILVPVAVDRDFGLKIINPDGSEAEKSGNGLRIFSRYLWDKQLVSDDPFTIQTKAGFVSSRVFESGRLVEVSMGKADFSAAAVKMDLQQEKENAINFPLSIQGKEIAINAVSMGNPHCVVFCDSVDSKTAKELGPQLERHPLFLERTNVQFVRRIDRSNIQIEIWERGAGYTLASGTSSCAAACMAVKLGYCENSVRVHMPGGQLNIDVDNAFNATMLGPVTRIGHMSLDQECFSLAPAL